MLKKAIISSLLIASSFSAIAEDEHLHDTDIQPWRVGAEIFLNGEVFEADFGDLGGGAFATDEPGIDSNVEKGPFEPGNWLQYMPQGHLHFWDGEAWTETMPNGEYINILDALDKIVRIDANGSSGGAVVIGEVDANGKIHSHNDFSLMDASNTLNGTAGAYSIELKLFESAPDSEISVSYAAKPVLIVFNQGLEEEDFERAVEALAHPHAAAEYDDLNGTLSIEEVEAFGVHYKVKLKNQGNFLFQLIEAEEVHEEDGHDH